MLYLSEYAEEALGNGRIVVSCVITVPADFNMLQRRMTMNAGVMAGMKVLNIINEPTAALMGWNYDGLVRVGDYGMYCSLASTYIASHCHDRSEQ